MQPRMTGKAMREIEERIDNDREAQLSTSATL